MKKRPDIVALVLLVVLTAYAVAQQWFILPVIRYMLVQANAFLSLPGRIFIQTSKFGALEFLAFVILTLVALKRLQPAGDRAQQARVLNLASILMVLFLLGQASLYVDLAKSAGKVMHAGQTASGVTIR